MTAIVDVSEQGIDVVMCDGSNYDENMQIVIGDLQVTLSWEQLELLKQAIDKHFGLPDDEDEG